MALVELLILKIFPLISEVIITAFTAFEYNFCSQHSLHVLDLIAKRDALLPPLPPLESAFLDPISFISYSIMFLMRLSCVEVL